MKKLILTMAGALTALSGMATLNRLPQDSAVRRGVLPNGLTYYLRHNETPSKSADFFLAQRVGSVNEDEDQRGLAHFLEHLCFNGSRHFPGNSMISYLESIGVKFGANLNAYTSTDETVYNICDVPVVRESVLDSCLLIMRDWCRDLTLSEEEIEKERGVVKSEWRHRGASAAGRMLERAAPEIFAGSRYGRRLPIGLMEVVENAPRSAVKRYYDTWYHPENQCVIVVGDIDVDKVENAVKRMFGDIPPHAPSPLPDDIAVPDNDEMIVSVQSDRDQRNSLVQLYIKRRGISDREANTIAEIRQDYELGLIAAMLAERFDDIEHTVESPYIDLGVGDVSFLLARTQRAFAVRGVSKKGRENDCLRVYARELKRAAAHGFSENELERAKLDGRANLDSEFVGRNHKSNSDYARKYVRHYLDGGELMSADDYHKMMKGVERTTGVEQVNARIRDIVDGKDRNLVVLAYLPDDVEGVTDASLREAWKGVDMTALGPHVDRVSDKALLADEPDAGVIVSEKKLDKFDSELWTLGNGIKVYVRQNSEDPDGIVIAAHSPGGFSSRYDIEQVPNYLVCDEVLALSGFGGHSSSDLRKMLVGKKASVSVGVGNMDETLSVSTNPRDLSTAMQMIYLKATAPERDDKAFDAWLAAKRMNLESKGGSPVYEMGDSIHSIVYARHPLGCKLKLSDLDKVNYDSIIAIHKDRFGDMSDFSFFITGNFDRDTLKTLVNRYVASLPGRGRSEHSKDIGYRYENRPLVKVFERQMETPVSITYSFLHGPMDYNLDNVVACHAVGDILKGKLRDDLREDKGWTYGVQTHCGLSAGMNGDDPANFIMPVYIKVEPGREADCHRIVGEKIQSLADKGCITDDEVNKVKQYLLKNMAENVKNNSYWLTILRMYDKFNKDMHSGYDRIVGNLSAERLRKFSALHLKNATRLKLTMQPRN